MGHSPYAPAVDTETVLGQFERLVMGAVGLTTQALGRSTPGVDLTFPQWRVLVILGESENGARVGEIASRVGVTVPATSRLLQRLRRRGYISLERDPGDGRATRARLTVEGHEIRDTIFAFRRRAIAEVVEQLDEAGRPAVAAGLAILSGSLDGWL
jgi:DNA-binding MarR family transcriptional regulator